MLDADDFLLGGIEQLDVGKSILYGVDATLNHLAMVFGSTATWRWQRLVYLYGAIQPRVGDVRT